MNTTGKWLVWYDTKQDEYHTVPPGEPIPHFDSDDEIYLAAATPHSATWGISLVLEQESGFYETKVPGGH